MDTIEQMKEEIMAITYGNEFRDTKNLFVFIDKVTNDNLLNTLKFEKNRSVLEDSIISVLTSISREIIREIEESKYQISHSSEFKNGEWIDIYFDRKKNKFLSSRIETYPTNDIILYHDKILQEEADFFGKKEVLNTFYEAYLSNLSQEAKSETHYCKDINSLLDLFNNPKYKEVKEDSILPALSDKVAEQLSPDELKFKNIEEATRAYEKDGSLDTLAQLKKLHMIKAIQDTENCYDYEDLGIMLKETTFNCVEKIIIRRLVQLDMKKS